MSELKPYIGPHPTDHTLTEYYLKSEADKVIAEKNKELEELTDKNCDDALFLKAQIANLKEQKDMLGARIKRLVDET